MALFDITTFHLTEHDVRKAKAKMLMTHPDQSRLPSDYFLFYRQAFEVVLTFYREQSRQRQSTENVGDYVPPPKPKDAKAVQERLENMGDFQARFNQLYDDQFSNKPNQERNAWFSQEEPVFAEAATMKDLAMHRRKQQQVAAHRGVVQEMRVTQGAASLYDDEGDGDGGGYISSDVFSKLKFDDLRKVHKDHTVFDVSETDFVEKYASLDQCIQQRTEVAPLSEHEAQRLLEEKVRIQRQQLMQREYAALQKEKENEQKTRNVMAQFRLLSND